MNGSLRSIPIWPSLVTCASLSCGFMSIVLAAWSATGEGAGLFQAGMGPEAGRLLLLKYAGILIFVAMVFDGFDGSVARLARQTSQFGAELDSLSDAVSFGVAPAFLCWQVVQHAVPDLLAHSMLTKLVLAASLIYAVCTVIRLARFNVETVPEAWAHRYFKGLPSPAAAGLVASLSVFYVHLAEEDFRAILWVGKYVMPAATLLAGVMMVSKVRYVHFVRALLGGRRSFTFFVLLVVGLLAAGFMYHYSLSLALLFLVYLISGILGVAYEKVAKRLEIIEEEGSFF